MEKDSSLKKNKFSKKLFFDNHALLEKRNPELAFLTHTFQKEHAFTTAKEGGLNLKKSKKLYSEPLFKTLAAWKNGLDLKNVEVLYIYGLGLGYPFVFLKEWLKEGVRDLIFIEEDPSIILAFMETKAAKEILKHKRVHIAYKKGKNFAKVWAEKFPVKAA